MYEAFFQLERRPFVASPRTDHYFPARSIEQARQSLTRCILRSEGPGVIVGPSGAGKSLLCFVLAKQFRDKMKVVVVQGGRLRTRKSLLQNILFELKQPFRGLDEDELRLQLLDYLEGKEQALRRLLLIVDDAHLIRGQVLADVASLCGHVREGEAIIQFVLAGGSALEEKLAHPRLESLQQRIAARCYLQALNYDESIAFVRAQIEFCGGQVENVISSDALNALFRASDGVPRLINQIGDHALLLSYLAKLKPVNKAAIEEAWSDLQQLPSPWQVTDHPASVAAKEESASIIEFGSLDDAVGPPSAEPDVLENPAIWIEAAKANPVASIEQNLWTIESGVARLHQSNNEDSADVESVVLKTVSPPSLPSDAEEPDMPQFATLPHGQPTPRPLAFTTPVSTSTVPAARPGIKRVANPFEGSFEIEEVVEDRLARKPTVGSAPLAGAPAVSALKTLPPTSKDAIMDEDHFEQFEGVAVDWMNFQATSIVGMGVVDVGPVMAPAIEADPAAWNVISTDGSIAAATGRNDDRDLLLVENDEPPKIRPVKRQEFRQLFAKMRGDNQTT
jgi:type II secretory pathway predicted ATPase ExeA